ncbi:unannotated protein [freshwater metagenome]|uniref:Unannotated protein n=1 Tax=freshwater metagenome TaxID=449393 RepID=A0A6J7HS10_9ZZZZ|nr:MMPL family transporter [Actinomycetota bacterium]
MKKLLTVAASPRTKWVVLAVWLLAMVAFGAANLPKKFDEIQKNDSASFLPASAESTKALAATRELTGRESVTILTVYRRGAGLTAADRTAIAGDRAQLNALNLPRTTAFAAPVISSDGTTALLSADIATNGKPETISDPVDAVREVVGASARGGLQVKVTGSAGYSADAIKVFGNINGTLLLVAGALVLFLLILIYRSPIFWLIPILAVGFAEFTSRSIGYLLGELGVTVNGQSSSIMSILVLGAGTDYALLLVARYREELRREPDRHIAMQRALTAAGPAIIASGITVTLAVLTLMLAEVNGTAGLGPLGALGVVVAMLSMLTLLPALLVIVGRRAFWPLIPHVGDAGTDVAHGAWRRWGEWIARRPRPIWIVTSLALLVMAAGLLNFSTGLTQNKAFRGEVESVQGQQLLEQSFPSGANAPTEIVVPDTGKAGAVAAAVDAVPGVASVTQSTSGAPGTLLLATLDYDPYDTRAYDLVPPIRSAAKQAGGQSVLVGGPTAVEADLARSSKRDTRLIIPIVLAVVFLVLMILLRALAAPLILMATVVLSFAAALGFSALAFDVIFGFPGSDTSLPLFGFVFLVALGVDYNIFLMARVREEAQRFGTEHGMMRGLAVTGGVITSAGIVLAGTFAVLGVLPLVPLTEIGFLVAFGVLLDTFVVRSTLVPALVFDLGKRVWWPSRLAHEGEPGGLAPQPEPDPDAEEPVTASA